MAPRGRPMPPRAPMRGMPMTRGMPPAMGMPSAMGMPPPMMRPPMGGPRPMGPPMQGPPQQFRMTPEQQYEQKYSQLVNSQNYTSQDDEEKKNQIGDFIFPYIEKQVGGDDAGKITGMIIDQDLNLVEDSVKSFAVLMTKIREGQELLKE